MEQYEIRPKSCNKTIQTALKHFPLNYVYIRWVGSKGGGVVVSQEIKKNKFDVVYTSLGFKCVLDGKKIFLFEFKKFGSDNYVWGKNWSLAYKRVGPNGVMVFASTGYPYFGAIYDGPDDSRLPLPSATILRCANFTHLIEITFAGKIPIRKTKYKMSGICNYWEIDPTRLPQKPL